MAGCDERASWRPAHSFGNAIHLAQGLLGGVVGRHQNRGEAWDAFEAGSRASQGKKFLLLLWFQELKQTPDRVEHGIGVSVL